MKITLHVHTLICFFNPLSASVQDHHNSPPIVYSHLIHVIMGWNQIKNELLKWHTWIINSVERYWCFLPLQFWGSHTRLKSGMLLPALQYWLKQPEEARNHISLPNSLSQMQFPKPDIVFVHHIPDVESSQLRQLYVFIYLSVPVFSVAVFWNEGHCKIWGLSNFQRSAILMSFGNTSLTTPSGPAAPAQARQRGKGSHAFLKVIYVKQNKWRAMAGL